MGVVRGVVMATIDGSAWGLVDQRLRCLRIWIGSARMRLTIERVMASMAWRVPGSMFWSLERVRWSSAARMRSADSPMPRSSGWISMSSINSAAASATIVSAFSLASAMDFWCSSCRVLEVFEGEETDVVKIGDGWFDISGESEV